MSRKWWVGGMILAWVGFLSTPGLAKVEVVAKGLTEPFNILVDDTYVYWNEGVSAGTTKRVSQCLKGASSTPTVRAKVSGGWPDQPDMTQDSNFVYFPMYYKQAGEEGYSAQIVRLAKAGLTAPSPLFKFVYVQDPPVCMDPGFPGVLEARKGSVYFCAWDFCDSHANEIRRVSNQGANTMGGVTLLGSTGGAGKVTTMSADNVYLYWGYQGAIRRIPRAGGSSSTLVKLSGVPSSLVTPTTGAGGGKTFWLEGNPTTLRVDLKQRQPGGKVLVLAGNLDVFPMMEVYTARALAVDDKYVYFFRKVSGVNQLVRVPIDGGTRTILAKGSDVVEPMGLTADARFVYWADQGDGPRKGTIKRVAKPR